MTVTTRRGSGEQVSALSERGAAADHPMQLSGNHWRETLRSTKERIKRDRVSMSAGSLAYHGFLSFFPAVIAALGILALVHVGGGALHHITHGIAKALPAGTAGVFNAAVGAASKRSSGSTVAVVIGIAIALWSASSAIAVLEQALDVAYEVPEDRKFLARRAHAVPLMILTVVLGGLGAALIVFGQPIGSAIEGVVPLHGIAFTVIWTVVRWVLTVVFISALFSAFYYLGPNRESPRWQWVSPGGLIATVVFLVASLGFSYYVSAFGSYGKTYGSFAGVAILIFWLYLTGFAFLAGGELNAELERQAVRAGESTVAEDGQQRFGRTVPGARRAS